MAVMGLEARLHMTQNHNDWKKRLSTLQSTMANKTHSYTTMNINSNSTSKCSVLIGALLIPKDGMGMVVGLALWLVAAMNNYFISGGGGRWFLDVRISNTHFPGSSLVRIMWSMESWMFDVGPTDRNKKLPKKIPQSVITALPQNWR